LCEVSFIEKKSHFGSLTNQGRREANLPSDDIFQYQYCLSKRLARKKHKVRGDVSVISKNFVILCGLKKLAHCIVGSNDSI